MMQDTSNLHLDVLDKQRQNLLEKLLPHTKGFILGGGTALSLQLAHRKSFDFDFFSRLKIDKIFLEKLNEGVSIADISVDSQDELTFFTGEEIKVTFLHYPFGYSFPLVKMDSGLELFSPKDIAVQKAYTVGRRGEYRDYFDIYAVLSAKYISLPEIILQAKKIYGGIFEEKIFLQQLVYFGDLLDFDIKPVELGPVAQPKVVKEFFGNLVKSYLK